MGDIFKRLVNLARSEISHALDPNRQLSDEFRSYVHNRPEYARYQDYFDAEFGDSGTYGHSSYHNTGSSQQQSSQDSYRDNGGYDPYAALEVSAGAPWEEIEKAYRKQARKYHPDRYQNEKERETATRVMAIINASYGFLKDKHGKK
ncbi:MAG: J domain-containing protein [Candidatus Sericytochromatia bacterium]